MNDVVLRLRSTAFARDGDAHSDGVIDAQRWRRKDMLLFSECRYARRKTVFLIDSLPFS